MLEDELDRITPQKKVEEMMDMFGQEVKIRPALPKEDVRLLRATLIIEEALETVEALGCKVGFKGQPENKEVTLEVEIDKDATPDLIGIADGCADLQVVTLGCASACGIDLTPVFDEVHRSNMSKGHKHSDGTLKITKRSDGKVLKPSSYSPPNLELVLKKQKDKT